jgi:sugar phosphate isomerase/epimerase
MNVNPGKYPSLSKSYKGFYPFTLATTSFIYPDDYLPNVRMLGPYVDEIELLLFESRDIESLFPRSVVDGLKRLARELQVGYNVHLPTDISLSAPEPRLQHKAVESYRNCIERMLPLAPSAFFLHVPYNETDAQKQTVAKWRHRVRSNLERLLGGGPAGKLISIETLDYPLVLIEDIIMELGLSICLDVGHLILGGHDIGEFYRRYGSKISGIHLHGVENSRDHLAADHLPSEHIPRLLEILDRFQGILSLEVFGYDDLDASLQTLELWWCNSGSRDVGKD